MKIEDFVQLVFGKKVHGLNDTIDALCNEMSCKLEQVREKGVSPTTIPDHIACGIHRR